MGRKHHPLLAQHIKAARSPAESTASKRVRAEIYGPTQGPKVGETAAQIAATSNISPRLRAPAHLADGRSVNRGHAASLERNDYSCPERGRHSVQPSKNGRRFHVLRKKIHDGASDRYP
jgi:hypothetical protein